MQKKHDPSFISAPSIEKMEEREESVLEGKEKPSSNGSNGNKDEGLTSTAQELGRGYGSLSSDKENERDDEIDVLMEDTNRMCRICLGYDREQDLISPCRCKGTSRWVHRSCLDQWRATNEDLAFSRCMECRFEYELEYTKNEKCLKWKYWFHVTADVVASFMLVALVVAIFGVLVWAFGFRGPSNTASTSTGVDQSTGCTAICQVGYAIGGGICICLACLGVYGLYLLCANECSPSAAIASYNDAYNEERGQQRNINSPQSSSNNDSRSGRCCGRCDCNCYGCQGCYCGPCDCGPCNCNCNDCGGDAGLVICVVCGIVLMLIGFFVGIVIAGAKIRYTMKQHSWILEKRRLVSDFRVRDLSKLNLDVEAGMPQSSKPDKNVPPPPESPTGGLSDSVASHLKKIGLAE